MIIAAIFLLLVVSVVIGIYRVRRDSTKLDGKIISISGIVYNIKKEPVGNVIVTLSSPTGEFESKHKTTDATGKYSFVLEPNAVFALSYFHAGDGLLSHVQLLSASGSLHNQVILIPKKSEDKRMTYMRMKAIENLAFLAAVSRRDFNKDIINFLASKELREEISQLSSRQCESDGNGFELLIARSADFARYAVNQLGCS